jgi:hypothetical protein
MVFDSNDLNQLMGSTTNITMCSTYINEVLVDCCLSCICLNVYHWFSVVVVCNIVWYPQFHG